MGILKKNGPSVTFNVTTMHCENCERRVKVALESVPGVRSAAPDRSKGVVVVSLDARSPADEATIRKELEAVGYPAT